MSLKNCVLITLSLSQLLITSVYAEEFPVTRVAAPGGEVVFANPREKEVMYDQFTYAATRRAGDFVYLSGLEIGPRENEGRDVEAFKLQVDRGLSILKARLEATDASFQDVVQIQSFHNCQTSYFEGDLNDQLTAIVEVKRRYMTEPYSTWTALCVAGHFSENTVVEIQLTAYAPRGK